MEGNIKELYQEATSASTSYIKFINEEIDVAYVK